MVRRRRPYPQPPPVRPHGSGLAWLAAAAALAAIVYANSLSGAFVHDDVVEIRDNPDIRRSGFALDVFGGAAWQAGRGYGFSYRPISWAAATLLWTIGGGSPWPYHALNVLLHALNTILIGILVSRLMPDGGPAPRPWLAAPVIAAALFAVHPVHAEAVAWVSGRSDLLAAALTLAAWLAASSPRGGWMGAVASGLLMLAALFTKETSAALILLVPMTVLLRRLAEGARPILQLPHLPLRAMGFQVAALAVYLTARLAALGQIGRGAVRGPELLNPLEGASPLIRILTSAALLPEHLRLLLWPVDLSIDYGFDQIPLAQSFLDPRVMASCVTIVLGLTVAALARTPIGRGTAALALLYAAAALPTSNLGPLPSAIFAERYLYLPSAFLCAGAAALLAHAALARPAFAGVFLAAVLMAGSLRTLDRNGDWRDAESIYRSSAEAAPRSARLQDALGVTLRDEGRLEEAEIAYRRALHIAPGFHHARAEAGLTLVKLGRPSDAMEDLRRAVAEDPGDTILLNNLGAALLMTGARAEAVDLFKKAVGVDPLNAGAWNNLGKAELEGGDPEGARRAFEAALRAVPGDPAARKGLAAVARASGG